MVVVMVVWMVKTAVLVVLEVSMITKTMTITTTTMMMRVVVVWFVMAFTEYRFQPLPPTEWVHYGRIPHSHQRP